MKKAILLLGMVTMIAGCIYLKNADMDTILLQQNAEELVYVKEYPLEYEDVITILSTVSKEETPDEEISDFQEEETEQVQQEDVPKAEGGSFIFSSLDTKEQKLYIEILQALLSYETETELSTIDAEIIDKVFNCVMLDHPEIFYIDGYKYTEYTRGNIVHKIVFMGNYLYDETEIKVRKEAIEQVVAQILQQVPNTDDEYLKVKYVYDVLIKHTEYDLSAADNQNICSVFLNGKSVCQGYAKAVQYLLQKLQIESTLVLGTVTGGEGHAWNMVCVNGQWYYLDATWGDAYYLFNNEQNPVAMEQTQMINYDYLCVTTSQLMQTHNISMPVALPECNAMTDNYYVREGLYFTSFDEERIRNVFVAALASGQDTVTIKCSDLSVYEEVSYRLLEEQRVFSYLSAEETIAYIDNREQCSLTFWL